MNNAVSSSFVSSRIITSTEQFHSLIPAWNQCVFQMHSPSIFLSGRWILAWMESFGVKRTPAVGIIEADNKVLAGAPLLLGGIPEGRRRPYALNGLMINQMTTRSGFVVQGPPDVKSRLGDLIGSLSWGCIHLGRLSSPCHLSSGFLEEIGIPQIKRQYDIAEIDATTSWANFLETRSANLRRSILQAEKKTKDFGLISYPNDGLSLENVMDDIERVSMKTWKYSVGTSLSQDRTALRFYRKLLEGAQGKEDAFVCLLFDDAEPIAFQLNVRFADRGYALKIGYDEQYARFGLGNRVLAESARWAIENPRISVLDLDCIASRGEYKRRWATHLSAAQDCILFRKSPIGRARRECFRIAKNGKNFARQSIQKFGAGK